MFDNLDILTFVEDPGAANYLLHIPAILEQRGFKTKLFAEGFACNFLENQKVYFDNFESGVTAEQVFDRFNPKLIIIGTSENIDSFGFELISFAKNNNVTSIGAVDNSSNSQYRFRGRTENSLEYAPDWLFVPDVSTSQAFVELGYSKQKILVCGHPQYDNLLQLSQSLKSLNIDKIKKQRFTGLQENQKVVFFATVLSTGFCPQQFIMSPDFTLTGSGKHVTQTEIVLEEFLDAIQLIKPKPYLILRLHPKQEPKDFSEFLDDFNLISSDGLPYELIYISDLVVGLPTMLLVEATLLGKPTIAIVAQSIDKVLLPTIQMGITPCVNKRMQLRSILPKYLHNKNEFTPSDLSERFVFGAMDTMAQFIENLLLN